jgi:hypothetical protein
VISQIRNTEKECEVQIAKEKTLINDQKTIEQKVKNLES